MTPAPIVIENCAIATMDGRRHDDTGAEHRSGHIVISGRRITVVGEGPAPASGAAGARRVDGTGCLATPGLINTHHHLYQWLTQGRAQQSVLFDWLTELYPVWARIDPAQVHAAATAGLGWLALSGCTTSTDHHYIFRPGERGVLEAEITAAAGVGVRFHPCRGSMDLGRSAGGLPPDAIVEDPDDALAATAEAVRRFHDPSPGAMVRIAVAPCSPFSVSSRLMRCLGRADEIGALRPGMLADVALWRVDTLAHDAIAHDAGPDGPDGDPVAALVFGPPAPLELLLVGGAPVVERDELRTIDMTAATREVRAARRQLGPGT
jgi:cytosine/adenosine deaminase-related metal-dependent hydrolase